MQFRVCAINKFNEMVDQPRIIEADTISQAWEEYATGRGLKPEHIDMWWRDCATISEDQSVALVSKDEELIVVIMLSS